MKLKDGVELTGLRREIIGAFTVIDQVHQDMSSPQGEATLTSTVEGLHSVKRSAHYSGDAVDVRVWDVDGQAFADALAIELGVNFVVLFENDHVHVHWGPVYAG